MRYLYAPIWTLPVYFDVECLCALLARRLLGDGWARVVVSKLKVMRQDIFNCLYRDLYLVVSLLVRSEKHLHREGFVSLKLLFCRLEAQLLLIFLRHIDPVRYFCFRQIFNDEGLPGTHASESRSEEDLTIVFKFQLRFSANTSQWQFCWCSR